jgi:hypothetical protein
MRNWQSVLSFNYSPVHRSFSLAEMLKFGGRIRESVYFTRVCEPLKLGCCSLTLVCRFLCSYKDMF